MSCELVLPTPAMAKKASGPQFSDQSEPRMQPRRSHHNGAPGMCRGLNSQLRTSRRTRTRTRTRKGGGTQIRNSQFAIRNGWVGDPESGPEMQRQFSATAAGSSEQRQSPRIAAAHHRCCHLPRTPVAVPVPVAAAGRLPPSHSDLHVGARHRRRCVDLVLRLDFDGAWHRPARSVPARERHARSTRLPRPGRGAGTFDFRLWTFDSLGRHARPSRRPRSGWVEESAICNLESEIRWVGGTA